MNTQTILTIMQLLLSFGNLCILGYAFIKFLNKPHDSVVAEIKKLKDEIAKLNAKIEQMQRLLDESREKHKEQDKTNKAFKKVFLLLANFEVTYCQETGFKHTDDLVQAKKELEEYLTGD